MVERSNGCGLTVEVNTRKEGTTTAFSLERSHINQCIPLKSYSAQHKIGLETPYRRMFTKDSKLSQLRMIGSVTYVHKEVRKDKTSKLAWRGLLVGYDEESPFSRIHKAGTQKLIKTRNIRFVEAPTVIAHIDRERIKQERIKNLKIKKAHKWKAICRKRITDLDSQEYGCRKGETSTTVRAARLQLLRRTLAGNAIKANTGQSGRTSLRWNGRETAT